MHEALILITRAMALAHDHWRTTVGRRRQLSGKVAVLEERVQQLETENALFRSRLLRVPGLRRVARGLRRIDANGLLGR